MIVAIKTFRESAQETLAQAELQQIFKAVESYLIDANDVYPADVNRALPPGIEQYLGAGQWPDAHWPGSVYDWDNIISPSQSPVEKYVQISIRFCPLDEPTQCQFPNEDWAIGFDYYSSAYYCIEGPCRSHSSKSLNWPGYCFNCAN